MKIKDGLVQRQAASTAPDSATVRGLKGQKYRFTVLADGIIRYEWAPDGHFEDRPSAFASQRDQATVPEYRTKDSDRKLEIITSHFHLTYNKQEFAPHGLFALIFGHTSDTWRYGKPSETLDGTTRTLDNVNGRTALEPSVVSRKGFASLEDKTMLFEKDGFIGPRRPGAGRVDGYLFAYGHDYRAAIKALYSISGFPPIIPRWALGNWWSRYYEYTTESYLSLMDEFEKYKIPLSVAVLDMDWHLVNDNRVKEAGQSGWTGYTWNRELFPDPPEFLKELHQRGLRVTVNDHPADGVASYEEQYAEFAEAVGVDPASRDTVPFDITDKKYLRAYINILLRGLEQDGVDFFWVDWQQGQWSSLLGVDPLWVLNHFHYLHNASQNERGLVFSRYAGPGSHRYPIGFSGDTVISWESLAFQPEFTASASNIGYGWWSHDIGGHMLGSRDDELTARWVQLGVFSPIMRLHSTKNRWLRKEPWLLREPASDAVMRCLRLRHRMIPYLHTMNIRASKGEPLVQPMYWLHPERREAYQAKTQYMFGTELMVVPITQPQDKSLKMGQTKGWLPPGKWVDLFSGVVYTGDREIWLSRDLDKFPVLMKEGSIVPLDSTSGSTNDSRNPAGLEIVIAVGADAAFDIIEDNEGAGSSGPSPTSSSEFVVTPIRFTQESGTIRIGPKNESGVLHIEPAARDLSIRLMGMKNARQPRYYLDGVEYWPRIFRYPDGLVINIGKVSNRSLAVLELGCDPQLDRNEPLALIEPVLSAAEIPYDLKDSIWEILAAKGVPVPTQLSQLEALEMSSEVRAGVSEYLHADVDS